MNPIDDITHLRGDDDRQFDLLVDGELSEAERRALLCRLDQEPDGWRRCALAFLEAQCWGKELGAMTPPLAASPSLPQPARRRPWRHWLGTVAAMAASFLVALVLGTQLRTGGWYERFGRQPDRDMMATTAGHATPGPEPRQDRGPGASRQPAAPSDGWELVTLAAPSGPGGSLETIRVPAVRKNALDEQWLGHSPLAVPEEVLRAFRRMGHDGRQQRELVPLEMQDGRRLVVPVDRVEVQYVGRPAF